MKNKTTKKDIAKTLTLWLDMLLAGSINKENCAMQLANYVLAYKKNPNCPEE